ncbi:MAG TPA: stage II sporulation protein D [Bacillota bacterium]|nr:stage II sporulation protein D [Bacillota bacterium]HOL08918.1 stage II sporulation protein D [Bacillota bacterium]HPO96611.1 stage II sporulation protein D [Bacillota bacterium]
MQPNKSVVLLLLFTLLVLTPMVVIKLRSKITHISGPTIPVTLISKNEGKLYRLDLEDYLVGVVAAEMPAEFELEALKAQAVAARTVTVQRLKRYGGRGTKYSSNADFSDDPNESQAWLSNASLQNKWSKQDYHLYYRKVKQAVLETRGIIMVYHNKPIDAVYHSTCGGATESAINVWSYDIPYLRAVKCGFDQHSRRYQQRIFSSWRELAKRFNLSEAMVKQIRITKRTASGRISQLSVGNRQISGKDFRQKLALNSTYFELVPGKEGLTINVTGYGHGVGLCQYGADGMAKQGVDYQQILKHYYQGIEFRKIKF